MRVKNKFKNSIFILSGDFNLPDINWKTNTIVGSQYSLSKNQLFLDLTNDLGLTQTVQEPTRGSNILDIFFINNMSLINKTSVVSGVSDHEAVVIESNLSIKPKKPSKREIKLWNRADIDKLKTDTKNFSNLFKNTNHKQDINDMWPQTIYIPDSKTPKQ